MLKRLWNCLTSDESIPMTARQEKIRMLLASGKRTVSDLTFATGFCDPRSYIRDLRKKGVNVMDEWVISNGVRFKRYWI